MASRVLGMVGGAEGVSVVLVVVALVVAPVETAPWRRQRDSLPPPAHVDLHAQPHGRSFPQPHGGGRGGFPKVGAAMLAGSSPHSHMWSTAEQLELG